MRASTALETFRPVNITLEKIQLQEMNLEHSIV